MQDLSNKVDGVDTLPADQWNEAAKELVNIIEANGQAPSQANLLQVLNSIVEYGVKGTYHTDSGVDGIAYALTPTFAGATILSYKDGMTFQFEAALTNVNASPTVNVSSLGPKSLTLENGANIFSGAVIIGRLVKIIYRSGTDTFEIIGGSTQSTITELLATRGHQYVEASGVFNTPQIVLDYNLPIRVTVTSGGGGGAFNITDPSLLSGGAGAATNVFLISNPAASYAVTVGAGGAAGTPSGVIGGISEFGAANNWTARPGAGGVLTREDLPVVGGHITPDERNASEWIAGYTGGDGGAASGESPAVAGGSGSSYWGGGRSGQVADTIDANPSGSGVASWGVGGVAYASTERGSQPGRPGVILVEWGFGV